MFQGCDDPECHACQMNRRMLAAVNAQNAANMRRSLWVDTFLTRIKQGDLPSKAANIASMATVELDRAFPEVKDAAMEEDR